MSSATHRNALHRRALLQASGGMLATLLAGCRGCQGTGGGLDDSGTGGTPGGDIPQVDAEALDDATAAIFAGSRWEDDVVGLGAVLQDLVNETAAVAPTTAEGLAALLNEMMIPIYANLSVLFDGSERTAEEVSDVVVALGESLDGTQAPMMANLDAATAEVESLVGDLSALDLDLSENLADIRAVEIELREEIHNAGMSGEVAPNVLLSALGKLTRFTHDPDLDAVHAELVNSLAFLAAQGPPPPSSVEICIAQAQAAFKVNMASWMAAYLGGLLGAIPLAMAVPAYGLVAFMIMFIILTAWLAFALDAELDALDAAIDSCIDEWEPFITP